jgi:hypothetical protein
MEAGRPRPAGRAKRPSSITRRLCLLRQLFQRLLRLRMIRMLFE